MENNKQALSQKIDLFFTKIMQLAENKQEVLLGKCESGAGLTNTQEHILMLLLQDELTNAELADMLNVSPAAVTKALKKLQLLSLVCSEKSTSDARIVLWQLSEKGRPIAKEHGHHHQATLATYSAVVSEFSDKEQETIMAFLEKMERKF
ncbi:MAG: zinc-dependent MarR family transcriptional regulator [Lactococcus sp.]|uniref:zinc-dependent MarR family transcriptional regulator n=1 Tax=Pseudolactococcus carnosus TaxID=2749961 RepID=UPI001FBA8234|nr:MULTISPECIES: zinc-dependent MarR family transcriptional regulator [Lactococcus]MCJ1980187.1 MarR family transcriptional regulator [Lactococcus carnosus]MDN5402695.1 zinc-dependent MarR family transcriptional regulator [Lactococcus sp.]MDN5408945.1 zinc-dependent MarR family transcriptional regulator [Lactococcus sp.]MDN5411058.1 zinc-dependent MarR family transcriptional regulator [Lactococcus sp.]MDN5435610.1 zinc-dependent MarR family transcriptional regulator [Lactococcus sp.]